MNRHQKSPQTQLHNTELSDDSLSNEWQLHDNRLNFLQHSIAKIQKKILKLQKTIIIVSDSSTQLKNQFRQKINQIITIVSQTVNSNDLVTTQQFAIAMSDIKNIAQIQSECLFNCENLQNELQKLTDKGFCGISGEIKDFVNDRVATAEIKSKKFVEDKVFSLMQSINELEKTVSFAKLHTNNILNNSAFSKASSSHNGLSNSRSQNKLSNSRSSNLFECPQPIRESIASKRLTYAEDEVKKYTEPVTPYSKPSVQGVPTNQNSSRVVYLRQKLKEFEEINKKYEKKESEYEHKQKQAMGNNSKGQKNLSIKKNSNSLYTYQADHPHQHTQPQQTQPTIARPHQREPFKETQLAPSYRQQSIKKYAHLSSSKSNAMSIENSARKMDKLKSIKDYLEQTESEIDDSFLEPHYHGKG